MAIGWRALSVELVVPGVGNSAVVVAIGWISYILSVGFVNPRGWAFDGYDGSGCSATAMYAGCVWVAFGFE